MTYAARFVAICALVCLPTVWAQAESAKITDSTVRLQLQTVDGDYVVTGHGSAFGVDLTAYGLRTHKYLLSAAHLVLAKDGHGLAQGDLRLEVGADKKWAKCTVLAVDKKNDLCLLESERELTTVSKLATGEQSVGDALAIVGCPKGVRPCVSYGKLISKEPAVEGEVWEAKAKFWHGNSGGPVFDAKTSTIIGVAVAGVQVDTGDMDTNTALFTPLKTIRKFVETALPKLKVKLGLTAAPTALPSGPAAD